MGAWGWRGRLFGPGEFRLALLSLLADAPAHGYELMRQLERRSGGIYEASAGSVYPTLQQLEDEGLVRSEASNGRRVYSLTDEGRREVEQERVVVERIWRRAEGFGDWGAPFDPDTAELMRPALRLLRAAVRAARRARDLDALDRVREILERAHREIRDLDERSG